MRRCSPEKMRVLFPLCLHTGVYVFRSCFVPPVFRTSEKVIVAACTNPLPPPLFPSIRPHATLHRRDAHSDYDHGAAGGNAHGRRNGEVSADDADDDGKETCIPTSSVERS